MTDYSLMGIGVPIFIAIVFMIVVGGIVFVIISSIKSGVKNSNSPRITTIAKVINKRQLVKGEHTHTYYYATFEFESGERTELTIEGKESGLLVEGDLGKLTIQGTRFISFVRGV